MRKPTSNQRDASMPVDWSMRDRSGIGGESGAQGDVAADQAVQTLSESFAASMAEAGLDREEQDFLGQVFEQQLRDSAAGQTATAPLTGSDWSRAVEVLRQAGAIDATQATDLARKLDEATRPLQSRNVQLGMEFSRRYSEDSESAMEWYRDQLANAPESGASSGSADVPVDRGEIAHPHNLITKSRSRQLRGPPAKR